jgi:uncharacterized protein YgiM (DUF1202 family)
MDAVPMNKSIARLGLTTLCVALVAATVLIASPANVALADNGSNWSAQYWNNNSLTGNPTITRTEAAVNFNWGSSTPDGTLAAGNWSARWTYTANFAAGSYFFRAGDQGGVRFFIDSTTVIDQFTPNTTFTNYTATVNLPAGSHTLRVDYISTAAPAGILVDWVPPAGTSGNAFPAATAVPTKLKAVVIVSTANVRSDPSTNGAPKMQVYYGDTFTVLSSNSDSSWFLVQFGDTTQGWIFHNLIYIYGGSTNTLPVVQSPVTAVPPPATLANVQAYARIDIVLRDGPSQLNAKKIAGVKVDTPMQVLAVSRNGAWALVSVNGQQGWVFTPYITVTVGDLGFLPVHN